MKRLIIILLTIALTLSSAVSSYGLCPSAGSDKSRILSRLEQANDFSGGVSLSFTQARHSPMLSQPLKGEGKLFIMGGDKLRYEMTSPANRLFILNGDTFRSSNDDKTISGNVTTDRRFRTIAKRVKTISGKSLFDESLFDADVLLSGSDVSVTLTPKSTDLSSLFSRVLIKADSKTSVIKEVILFDSEGGYTEYVVKAISFGALKDDVFTVER